MQSTPPTSERDALSTLRIDRSAKAQPSPRGWLRGWILWVSLLLIAGCGFLGAFKAGWIGSDGQSSSWLAVPDIIKNRPEVRIERPVVSVGRAADATVVATGYLESRRQAKIGARAPGRIQMVAVEEGSRVTKDEVLAILEHADLDASLAASQASLERAQAAIAEQDVLIAQNLRELDRASQLLASQSIPDAEYDQAKFQYDSAVARMQSLKADVMLAEARLREAEQLKENMFIRAPFDGTVISKDAEVGESILPGGMGEASGRGSAVTIADLDNLEVDCDVKEDYIGRIRSGQATEVAVDAVPDRRYHGLVRKVIPMGDRARATIKVKVSITDADSRLFPDMSSTVYFLPDQTSPASEHSSETRIFCSQAAVQQDSQGDFVWTIDDNDHAQRLRIQTGATRDGRVEVLAGLSGDEKLIANPGQFEVNQAVKVLD